MFCKLKRIVLVTQPPFGYREAFKPAFIFLLLRIGKLIWDSTTRLWWARKKRYIKEKLCLTLHLNLDVKSKVHLISYLDIKNPNCGKGYAVPRQICFGT